MYFCNRNQIIVILKNKNMEILTMNEMERILGGGWTRLSDGTLIFIPDGDEESEDDFIIFG
jgi:hypothetical protein